MTELHKYLQSIVPSATWVPIPPEATQMVLSKPGQSICVKPVTISPNGWVLSKDAFEPKEDSLSEEQRQNRKVATILQFVERLIAVSPSNLLKDLVIGYREVGVDLELFFILNMHDFTEVYYTTQIKIQDL